MSRRPTRRSYESPLRARQAEQTRLRIVEALVEELALGKEETSMAQVAERAGVSLRTVYHHLPNRDAQMEAVATLIDERLCSAEPPTSPADVPEYAAQRARQYLAHDTLIRAQLSPAFSSWARANRPSKCEGAIERCLQATGAADEDTRLAGALLKQLISPELQLALLDRQKLSAEEAPRVVAWAVEALLSAVAKGVRSTADAAPRA